ncbi:MAG TPA: hypothetical protein VJP80_08470 [Candidatus Saccharimonadales bacterium]|nr:hypothetical protein [Candidatus Saccharimonadales bacterium]
MNILYKYAAYLGMAAILVAAGGATGWHLGALSSAEKLAKYQAASAQAIADAKTAASQAQSKADQDAIDQAKAMAAQANQAVIVQQASAEHLQATISGLRSQIAANAKSSPTVAQWIPQPIPVGALNGLCFPKTQADTCKEP